MQNTDVDIQPPKSAEALRDLLAEAAAKVRMEKLDPKTANAVAYVGATLLRAIEVADVERRVKVLEDLIRGLRDNI